MTIKKVREKPNPQLKNEKRLLFLFEESIPLSKQERERYVSDIAFFYSTIFKKKLQHFIGMQLEELARIGRTEIDDNIIRSNISCFRLIDEWMEKKTNEHIGNVENIRLNLETDQDFINDLKKKTL